MPVTQEHRVIQSIIKEPLALPSAAYLLSIGLAGAPINIAALPIYKQKTHRGVREPPVSRPFFQAYCAGALEARVHFDPGLTFPRPLCWQRDRAE